MKAPSVSLRAATEADVPAIVALVNDAFAVERSFVDRDRTNASDISGMLARGTFLVLDADEGGLLASVYLERRGDRAYLGMLSIQPLQQGKGLGRAVMAAAESHAVAWGCSALDIRIVSLRTELPPFYQALGFVESGRTDVVDDPAARQRYYFVLMTKGLGIRE